MSDYQTAELNLLLSALEQPKKRLPQVRHSFSQRDFRDETAREIYDACVALLGGHTGVNDQEITAILQDRLGLQHPVTLRWIEVSAWPRAGLREDADFKTLLRRMGEVKQRYDIGAVMDKIHKSSSPGEITVLAKQLEALEQPQRSIADAARVNLSEYESVTQDRALTLLPHSVWKGFIREGTLTLIAGESKAKKSWFALSLLQHAILGEPYLERPMLKPSTGEQRRVFLMDFEMPRAALMSRWVALAGECEWEDRPVLFDNERVSLETYRPLMTSSRDWIAYICGQVVACCNPGDVMLIDCLQPIMAGGDANAAEVVRPLMARLQSVADQTGASVIVIDHFNKSEGGGKNRISGSVAKAAAPDTVITLNSAAGLIEIQADLRMEAPCDPFCIEFRGYAFARVSEEEREERKQAAKDKELREFVQSLPFGWFSKDEVAEQHGRTDEWARKKLISCKKWLEQKKDGKKHLFKKIDNGDREH